MNRSRYQPLRIAGALALIGALALPPTPVLAEEPVSLNFVNAEIDSVVRAISKLSGRNFVIDPRVKGNLNIVSAKPVAASMTYEILLSALRVHGFSTVESRGVTLIVPEADAKLHYSGTTGGKTGERIVTEVLALEHESAVQLLPVLKPLVSPNNNIAAYAGSNMLVVTDYAENVRKIKEIVDAVDKAGAPEPVVVPLKHASAPDLVPLLVRLVGEPGAPAAAVGGDAGRRLTLVPDVRSNSLLIQAPTKARLERLLHLLAKLDVPAAGSGNMRVIYLKNADAVKLAQTLRAVLSADTSAPSTPSSAAGQAGAARSGGSEAMTPGIVQADAATNSLIITAPEPTFNSLRAIIEKLDMRRAQVFVEALIAEVSAEKATEFGIQWNAMSGASGSSNSAIGGTNFTLPAGTNILGVAANPTSVGRGLNIGIVRGTITLPGSDTPILNLGALARALESDTRTNILSTPNLLTLDSEEAKIIVGKNVPFVTGSYAQTGTGGATPTPFQTIERKDVGLTLKVKPQITEGGAVRMQVFQEVSSVSADTSTAGVITNKRSVESNVVVDDGDFIVLGGLIQDSVERTADKVPWLGDLPWVGWLFRYETQKRLKTNLMVFLRPVVVRGRDTAAKLVADRYDYLLGEQTSVTRQANTLFSNEGLPQLPERDGITGLPPSPSMKQPPKDQAPGGKESTPSAQDQAPPGSSANSAAEAAAPPAGEPKAK